jgi:periplasmic protein TonB
VELFYRARNWIASAPTILVVAAALVLTTVNLPKPVKEPPKTPVKIQLTSLPEPPPPEPAPPPPPAPPVPPTPEPPPPVPVPPRPVPVVPPQPPIAKPRPIDRPAPKPVPTPQPAVAPPQPTPTPAATAPATTATAAPAPAAPAAPVAPARPSSATAEDAYTAKIRADIEANKHYPNGKEARLSRPRGDAEVWFRLDRSGSVKEAGIQTSSGSLILDQAALALVRGGSYPAFPADAYPGAADHRFVVTLSYVYS